MNASRKAGVLIAIFGLGAGALSTVVQAADPPAGSASVSNGGKAGSKTVRVDFSNFPDRQWKVGDGIKGAHGEIEFREFFGPRGNASQSEEQKATVVDTARAGGRSPELKTRLINVRFTPSAPVARVTLKFAQESADENVDLVVNGDKRSSGRGLIGFDNQMIGGARVTVGKIPGPGKDHPSGRLELLAVKGKIESFAVGAREGVFDDVELHK
jgi:hypothetical protein